MARVAEILMVKDPDFQMAKASERQSSKSIQRHSLNAFVTDLLLC